MKRFRRLPVVVAICCVSIAAGIGARSLHEEGASKSLEGQFRRVFDQLLDEIADEEGLAVSDRDAFIKIHLKDCVDLFVAADEERRVAHRKLHRLFKENFTKSELSDFVVDDPRDAEFLLVITVEWADGTRTPVPIDAADWPDHYKRTRYGLGARNAVKSHLYKMICAESRRSAG